MNIMHEMPEKICPFPSISIKEGEKLFLKKRKIRLYLLRLQLMYVHNAMISTNPYMFFISILQYKVEYSIIQLTFTASFQFFVNKCFYFLARFKITKKEKKKESKSYVKSKQLNTYIPANLLSIVNSISSLEGQRL